MPFATAGLSGDISWSKPSPDGKFLLVILLPKSYLSDEQDEHEFDSNDHFDKFPESGVYLNDGSDKLLWKLPYYSHCYRVYFSDDGQHLIFAAEDTTHNTSDFSHLGAHIYFAHQDSDEQSWQQHQVTRGLALKSLIDKLLNRQYLQWEEVTFDAANNTYTIQTSQHEEFVFDIRTGKKIRTTSLWNKCLGVFLVFIPLLVIASRRITGKQPSTKKWQFSMGGLLLLMTTCSALLALSTVSIKLAGVAIGSAVLGGAIAYFIARRRQAWFTGGLLAVYGLVAGPVLFALVLEPLLRVDPVALAILSLCSLLGCLAGAIFAGRLEKQQLPHKEKQTAAS